MEESVPKPELSPLSASKAKTLENCSWLYWCNYHLKLPQHKNEGAQKGEVCHWVFEILVNRKKHGHRVKRITEAGSVTIDKAVCRLIKLYIKKTGLPNHQTIFIHIDNMIVVGLRSDFYVKGGKLVSPEYKFDITKPDFRIKGFMDKPFIVGKTILIDDYKSSKMKFTGEDEESNLQALFYSYAARQIWPDLKPTVRFIFLQYPEDPIMSITFTEEALQGFEMYLKAVQERVNMFNIKSAKNAFAADSEPHDNGFNGKLLCGFAKSPDEKKKDGTKKWSCPYKFPFDYHLIKKGDKIVYTVFKEEDVRPLKPGETVTKMRYDGCPRFKNVIDDFGHNQPDAKPKTVYHNVLDDF